MAHQNAERRRVRGIAYGLTDDCIGMVVEQFVGLAELETPDTRHVGEWAARNLLTKLAAHPATGRWFAHHVHIDVSLGTRPLTSLIDETGEASQ